MFYNSLINQLEKASSLSDGPLRTVMGDMVEKFVDEIWNYFCKQYPNVKAEIYCGPDRPLVISDDKGNSITESVDRHCYINGKLVAAIECKTYLDKCFMQRADSDFRLMKQSEDFDALIVSLEDATKKDSYNFFINQGNINNVFFLVNSKRNSNRHISKHRENIQEELIQAFVNKIESYFIAAS